MTVNTPILFFDLSIFIEVITHDCVFIFQKLKKIVKIHRYLWTGPYVAPFFFFNSSFQKCRLKIANREWKMFHGELSAAVNKY